MDDPIGSQLLVQLLLICINAFFAATETAVVTLNENKIRKKAEDGDAKAILMLKMVESPTRFLSTIQVCITLSGFMASAFAASSFASVLANNLWNAGLT
ncbi:MAG: CNNM domain-containing protein, partial [Clostridia bacterium]